MSDTLRREIKDPRLQGVQVSEVELSGDLGVAKVYFSMLQPDADASEAIEALKSATGFLRRIVGKELRLRRVPELRFIHDDSARHGFEIGRLIDRARSEDSE